MPPQTPTQLPAASRRRTVWSTSRSTAGCRPSACWASIGCMRSIASTYWVRSLVPMEKKSTSLRQLRRHQRGRRHLDHDADLDRRGAHLARAPPRRSPCAARRSSSVAIIGNMIRTGPAPRRGRWRAAAGGTAPAARRHRRMPRTPRNGLSSCGQVEVRHVLVAADVERADDQRQAVERRAPSCA